MMPLPRMITCEGAFIETGQGLRLQEYREAKDSDCSFFLRAAARRG